MPGVEVWPPSLPFSHWFLVEALTFPLSVSVAAAWKYVEESDKRGSSDEGAMRLKFVQYPVFSSVQVGYRCGVGGAQVERRCTAETRSGGVRIDTWMGA